jgi:hypothetical protein
MSTTSRNGSVTAGCLACGGPLPPGGPVQRAATAVVKLCSVAATKCRLRLPTCPFNAHASKGPSTSAPSARSARSGCSVASAVLS